MPESLAVRRAGMSTAITRVHEVLESFAARDHNGEILTAVRHFPAREARCADFPGWVHPDLASAYAAKGIHRLYTHQAAAAEAVHAGKNVVIVTPTASGKTLCYNLPVLNAILENSDTRALYLFPTKALAQDQLAELYDLNQRLENRFGVFTFYGRDLQFICCSATIANPGDLAGRLLESEVEVLNSNGAPAAEKTFVFYNPPVVNRALGIRRSYINESSRVAQEFLKRDLQTMVFANSRLHTEVLLTYLQQANPQLPGKPETIRGYRGGYLPNERRDIERGLRDGKIRGVASTSALELGIDVGSLDAVVMAGYPGTIAATWQRSGRAGRRSGSSCAVLVASSAPLDQFIVRNPDYFFGNTPEHAFIQPDNLEILINHLKCAAFELPIAPGEKFGDVDLPDLCARLAEAGFLHLAGESYHWTHEAYPADTISLRSVTSDNFVIIDITATPNVIGEVDFPSALVFVHEKAIYIHGGQQHHVEHLDFKERKAYVKQVDVDYYTDAIRYTQVRVLETACEHPTRMQVRSEPKDLSSSYSHGDVLVRSQVVGFKKIKFFTNENVGAGKLELPENEMHTTSYWITLERPLLESLPYSISERQNGMFGLLYALESVATLLLMCDRRDLGTAIGECAPSPDIEIDWEEFAAPLASETGAFFEPNLYLYDAYPGGIGFSEPLYRI